ncbi:MAG: uncharacterized protein K0S45_3684 [Nitrospira sp.]|nr:uncharacterized protein [Nitrospira sp.]
MNSKLMTSVSHHTDGSILLSCLERKPAPVAEPASRPSFYPSDTLSGRLQSFLSRNLGTRVTLKELAHFLGYSEKYSSEFFRLQMGMCFSHYLKRLRLTNAAHMLANHTLSIAQIAESLGFSDSFAFSHFFKRSMGCSPTAYRKHHVNGC